MAPSEASLLRDYLLVPAQLPAAVSLREFTDLFPRPQQSSPHIRTLYRDLQAQRNALVDTVAADIDAEVKRGKALRREVSRATRQAGDQEADDEMEIERTLFDSASGSHGPKHNLNSLIVEMDKAAGDLEASIQELELQEASIRARIKQTVGNMSDLRYGRLANPGLRDDVLEGLQSVQEACKKKL